MSDRQPDCTEAWAAMPECNVCHRLKPPRGRSVPLAAATGYCHSDCSGYYAEPPPGHLWPNEWFED